MSAAGRETLEWSGEDFGEATQGTPRKIPGGAQAKCPTIVLDGGLSHHLHIGMTDCVSRCGSQAAAGRETARRKRTLRNGQSKGWPSSRSRRGAAFDDEKKGPVFEDKGI